MGLLALCLCGCGTDLFFGAASACPGGKGTEMISVEGFCIDKTEVTQSEYAEYLATEPSAGAQPAECAWNERFEPQELETEALLPPFEPQQADLPVGSVDFCDARAYCEWAGKRLCGKRGGGTLAWEDATDDAESEWFQVCSRGGALAYPYGQEFDLSACAVRREYYPVGTDRRCEGGVSGVFDLVGNVWEWEDACAEDGSPPQEMLCSRRGGAVGVIPETWTCAERGVAPRRTRQRDIGIRCCSDATK